MRAARRDLALPAGRLGLLVAGCGAHPFSAPLGAPSIGGRYEETMAEYGIVAELQFVFGLHVHRRPGRCSCGTRRPWGALARARIAECIETPRSRSARRRGR